MTLGSPWMLATLVVVPVLVVVYRRLLARRTARRAELARLGLVPASNAAALTGRRRFVPPLLMLGALALVLFSLARPQTTVSDPHREGTVVLAFDTSASMAAKDIAPTRIAAAQAAARQFVAHQPNQIKIGVVTFGDNAVIAQQPTLDRTAVLAAIDRLSPSGGTAIGRGLQSALSAIFGKPVLISDKVESENGSGASTPDAASEQNLGYTRSAAVVLLSDGENTAAPDPQKVAEVASTAGVRVYPIGLGSAAGTVVELDGYRVSTTMDTKALQQLAATTDGQYFQASDADELQKVYSSIELKWTVEQRPQEITALFTGAAAILLLLGAGLSWRWFGRVI